MPRSEGLDAGHLREDILTKPPLSATDRQRIVTLLDHLVGVGIEAQARADSITRRRRLALAQESAIAC
jgi:hypothetical protein